MAWDGATRRDLRGFMYLENLVIDAVEPQRLGRFWEAVVGGERLTDEPDAFETRLTSRADRCSTCASRASPSRQSSRRDSTWTSWAARQAEEVDRLLGLGAQHLDICQRDVPWVVLADPEGNPCCVMGGSRGVCRHRIPRGAPARLCRPGQGCGVLVPADRLDQRGRRRTPVPAPPVAAWSRP
jgi:hypothetical protein